MPNVSNAKIAPPVATYLSDEFQEVMKKKTVVEFPSLSDVLNFVRGSLSPEDVFPDYELEAWAHKKGFLREE